MFSKMISASPALATARFQHGATQQDFFVEIGYYINSGDTALHFAAASYRPEMASELIEAGAEVRAKNRRGTEPLHLAAVGGPNSPRWNPPAQSATIARLIKAGADPNAKNKDGTTPLHRAVRTRCADAVRTLLEYGADPSIRTKNGSTAKELAVYTTGRPGSGSPEAKAQQRKILLLLEGR
jgi:ankyrin repeat protein